jgi:DNA transposition AAA+ family ATPase
MKEDAFVQTQNVQKFYSVMKEAEDNKGEDALLVFHGRAGRGKTTTTRTYSALEGWTYVRAITMWTELWMLQDMCFHLGLQPIPGRKKPCFELIRDRLKITGQAMIIDEADKLSDRLLEVIRDLADITRVPFALVGEEQIKSNVQKERRRWSRTLRCVEFGPISARDILFFAKMATDMKITGAQAGMLEQSSEGDFRLVVRVIRRLEKILKANPGDGVTDAMVEKAIKDGLMGK